MAKAKAITPGDVYGRLTILQQAERSGTPGDNHRRVIAQCECGEIRNIMFSLLVTGKTVSCGCYRKIKGITHGRSKNDVTYRIYRDMLRRCNNPNYREFHLYGGRGIKVCERWSTFENFLADMGERPPGMSLERDRVNEGYGPDNCRWATDFEQANNKRNNVFLEYQGKRLSIAQWSRETGIKAATLYFRHSSGWPPERTLTQ